MSGWIDGNGGVHVVGIGMHRYQFPTEVPYTRLGLAAIREALADAGVAWNAVEATFVGTAALGMAAGKVMCRHLGPSTGAMVQIENASASGSFALRNACLEIACGAAEVALVVGVDKTGDGRKAADKDGLEALDRGASAPAVTFALMASHYLRERNGLPADLATVAVKNHRNASLNPYAQFRKPRTLEQVLASPHVAGDLTVQQCCPRGEGAAALLLASGNAIRRLGLDASRAVRVRSSAAASEGAPLAHGQSVLDLVQRSAAMAMAQAGIGPQALDLVELHDAFSVEELMYSEAIGVCSPGEGIDFLRSGASAIGGRCAINASGGLLGMGHPIGPTGVGQVAEITRQMRGEAGNRQHTRARWGLAHMIGLGSVGIGHVLSAPGI